MLKIHGVPFSAHTRKVIVTALEKGIPYELNPVVPLDPPPGWSELSPLGLIPVIQDGATTLADSSVIGLYLERRYPERAFYPADPAAFSIGDVAVASILLNYHYAGLEIDAKRYPGLRGFLERALKRASFRQALETEIPAALEVGGLDLTLPRRMGY